MRKVRQRPQVQKFLSTELYEFVFEEPCLSSPSTSKEHDQRTWERFEENPAKNDDPDELTDKSSDEESIFGDGEINDQENFEFFQARAKIIATDIKCMRRFQEVEAMLAKKQREMLARFPNLKLEDEEHKEKLDDSTLTCARCRPIPKIYQNRTRPRLIRQNLTPNSSNQPSILPQKGKSLERHFIDYFWHDAHLSKDVLNQRKEMFQEVDYVKKDSKTLQKFFTSDESKKRKSPKKKKPTTPTTSPLKNRKQQLPKKTIISSPIHKKLLKKSLARKRKANHKPSRPPPILRRSEGKFVKDFFSQGWRLSHESNSKNRSIRNIQLPSNEIHEALAKLANEAHYDEIFIPT
uniref:Uncharacterized protein n=1 Tax=Acrobeloides nanus TaxID=290746 RepID=A0A914BXI8_9BILA